MMLAKNKVKKFKSQANISFTKQSYPSIKEMCLSLDKHKFNHLRYTSLNEDNREVYHYYLFAGVKFSCDFKSRTISSVEIILKDEINDDGNITQETNYISIDFVNKDLKIKSTGNMSRLDIFTCAVAVGIIVNCSFCNDLTSIKSLVNFYS